MLKSMSYYNQTNKIISKNTNIQSLKDKVLSVRDNGTHCEVKTENGLYNLSLIHI